MEQYKDLTLVVEYVRNRTILPSTEPELINSVASNTPLTIERAEKAIELATKKDYIEIKNGSYHSTAFGDQYVKRGLIGRLDLLGASFNSHTNLIAWLALIVAFGSLVVAIARR